MGVLKSYNAGEVQTICGTRALTGLAEDTFVSVSRDEAIYSKQVGADGEVTRSSTNNQAGTATITLQQASDSNDFLTTLAASGAIFPFTVKDDSGRTVLFSETAWIEDYPDVEFGRDAGEREWTIALGNIQMGVAGN